MYILLLSGWDKDLNSVPLFWTLSNIADLSHLLPTQSSFLQCSDKDLLKFDLNTSSSNKSCNARSWNQK